MAHAELIEVWGADEEDGMFDEMDIDHTGLVSRCHSPHRTQTRPSS